ncbi:hypothetical protein L7F22_057718 [Adiantum nelumboides]|nr:hypothetical protein [Adiantum nelumboides]
MEEDWYAILGLQGGIQLSLEAVRKAFYTKALLCHLDKRSDDPLASAKFQSIQKAYHVLSNTLTRKAYHELLDRKLKRKSVIKKVDFKKRKMMEELNKKESLICKAQRQEEDDKADVVKHILHREILQMCENEKVVRVSWQGNKKYFLARLNVISEQFGMVEDIHSDST